MYWFYILTKLGLLTPIQLLLFLSRRLRVSSGSELWILDRTVTERLPFEAQITITVSFYCTRIQCASSCFSGFFFSLQRTVSVSHLYVQFSDSKLSILHFITMFDKSKQVFEEQASGVQFSVSPKTTFPLSPTSSRVSGVDPVYIPRPSRQGPS